MQKFFLSFYLQPTFSHRRAITQFLPHFPFLFASLFIIEKHLSHRAISFFSPSSPITDSFEQYFRDGARQPIVLPRWSIIQQFAGRVYRQKHTHFRGRIYYTYINDACVEHGGCTHAHAYAYMAAYIIPLANKSGAVAPHLSGQP